MLQASDRRVAIGTFDTGGAWVVPFQSVNDAQALTAMTNTIRSGGGTDILAGLRLVERDIINEPSQIKHLILLTDGGASPAGLVELTESLQSSVWCDPVGDSPSGAVPRPSSKRWRKRGRAIITMWKMSSRFR